MYVCIFVYICVYLYTYIYQYLFTQMTVGRSTHDTSVLQIVYVHQYVCLCMYMHIHTYVSVSLWMCVVEKEPFLFFSQYISCPDSLERVGAHICGRVLVERVDLCLSFLSRLYLSTYLCVSLWNVSISVSLSYRDSLERVGAHICGCVLVECVDPCLSFLPRLSLERESGPTNVGVSSWSVLLQHACLFFLPRLSLDTMWVCPCKMCRSLSLFLTATLSRESGPTYVGVSLWSVLISVSLSCSDSLSISLRGVGARKRDRDRHTPQGHTHICGSRL